MLQRDSDDQTLYSIFLQNAETVALVPPCPGLFGLLALVSIFFGSFISAIVSPSYMFENPPVFRRKRTAKSSDSRYFIKSWWWSFVTSARRGPTYRNRNSRIHCWKLNILEYLILPAEFVDDHLCYVALHGPWSGVNPSICIQLTWPNVSCSICIIHEEHLS